MTVIGSLEHLGGESGGSVWLWESLLEVTSGLKTYETNKLKKVLLEGYGDIEA